MVRCAIWYYLHNLESVKSTHECFSRFLNCINSTKSCNAWRIFSFIYSIRGRWSLKPVMLHLTFSRFVFNSSTFLTVLMIVLRSGNHSSQFSEVYKTMTSQASKMKLFAKIVSGWKPLTFFVNSSILDVWKASEYASDSALLIYLFTAWKVPVFGVFLVLIFPYSDWMQTRKTPSRDFFHTVLFLVLSRSDSQCHSFWSIHISCISFVFSCCFYWDILQRIWGLFSNFI